MFLFFCVFDFFASLGAFIFCTCISALVLSFTFLLPLFVIAGPREGTFGDVLALFKGSKNKVVMKKEKDSPEE